VCVRVCARVSSCVSRRRLFSLVSSADLFAWSIDGEFSSRSQKVRWETIRCSILRLVLDSFSLGKFSFFFFFFFFVFISSRDGSRSGQGKENTLFFCVSCAHASRLSTCFCLLARPGQQMNDDVKNKRPTKLDRKDLFSFFNPPAYSSFFFLLNVGQGPRRE
jgi:hypothetical protein